MQSSRDMCSQTARRRRAQQTCIASGYVHPVVPSSSKILRRLRTGHVDHKTVASVAGHAQGLSAAQVVTSSEVAEGNGRTRSCSGNKVRFPITCRGLVGNRERQRRIDRRRNCDSAID